MIQYLLTYLDESIRRNTNECVRICEYHSAACWWHDHSWPNWRVKVHWKLSFTNVLRIACTNAPCEMYGSNRRTFARQCELWTKRHKFLFLASTKAIRDYWKAHSIFIRGRKVHKRVIKRFQSKRPKNERKENFILFPYKSWPAQSDHVHTMFDQHWTLDLYHVLWSILSFWPLLYQVY